MFRVKYKGGKFDIVNIATLNKLIAKSEIMGFYRPMDRAWCIIGRNAVRRPIIRDPLTVAIAASERRRR